MSMDLFSCSVPKSNRSGNSPISCEYERVYPRTMPYSRLPYDKRAEKAWRRDYRRRNPSLLAQLARHLRYVSQ